jgi:hypothetical protein
MVYFMRTVPTGFIEPALKLFDELVLQGFQSFFPYKLDASIIAQIRLDLSSGGLGLRSTVAHQPAAFLSSLSAALPMMQSLFSESPKYSTDLLANTKGLVIAVLPIGCNLSLNPVPPQKVLSRFVNDSLCAKLVSSFSSDCDKARLLACSAPHASSFLSAIPLSYLGTKFTSAEWNVVVAFRLGVRLILEPNTCCPSKGCGKLMDPLAHHALRCKSGGDRVKRHNLLRDFFFRQCAAAQMSPLLEPLHLLRNCGARPADWAVPDVMAGRTLCCDLAVTDPLQVKFVSDAAKTPCKAAERYGVEVKLAKYSDLLARNKDIVFWPIIIESFGGYNSKSLLFFKLLSNWLCQRDPSVDRSSLSSSLFQRASCILQRANAKALLARIY